LATQIPASRVVGPAKAADPDPGFQLHMSGRRNDEMQKQDIRELILTSKDKEALEALLGR
jgi:hypothetical protein